MSLLSIHAWLVGSLIFLMPFCRAISQPSGPLIATNSVNFNGTLCYVDSFDSSDPTHSVWQINWAFNGQHYGTYTNILRKDNATVSTDGLLLNADRVSIYGSANTGPEGIAQIFQIASVGDLDWIGLDPKYPYNNGIQPGHLGTNMNFRLPDVTLPTPQNWLTVPAPTNYTIWIGGRIYTNNHYINPHNPYGYTIGGIAYSLFVTNIAGLPGTPTKKVYYLYPGQLNQSIFIDASNVVLYLPNGISFGSGDNFTLNTNANVQVYSGNNLSTANGFLNNLSLYALALSFYGLPACTTVSFGGNSNLVAWLYAPEGYVIFNGGGATIHYDVTGAIIAGDIRINGHFNFHFDEALAPSLPIPPWIWSQPKKQAVQSGSNATFTVFAGGTKPQWAQWFYNQNTPVPAGVDPTLTLPNVKVSDSGDYSVILTNSFGSVTSSPAILFVYTNVAQLAAQMNTPISDALGNFRCDVTGLNGFDYIVQASTNLTDWTSLQTNVVPFSFIDTNPETFTERFYRVLFPTSP